MASAPVPTPGTVISPEEDTGGPQGEGHMELTEDSSSYASVGQPLDFQQPNEHPPSLQFKGGPNVPENCISDSSTEISQHHMGDSVDNLSSGESHQSRNDATPTPPTNEDKIPVADPIQCTDQNTPRSAVVPHIVRDSSQPNGQADADEAYNRNFLEYYPKYKEKVYRVPPIYIGTRNVRGHSTHKHRVLREECVVDFRVSSTEPKVGETAEKLVSDNIEKLLIDLEEPAFIITSFKFENFCKENNKYTKEDGEHDILIIHYKCGVVFIQVKACGENTGITNKVKKALEQLKKDKQFFEANFNDLNLDVSLTTVVALPFISLNVLTSNLDHLKRIHRNNNCKSDENLCEQGCLQTCLLSDNMPLADPETEADCRKTNLFKWWNHIKGKGFNSWEDYESTVARYVGFKSTVPIKNMSQYVSEIGNRCMNIVLTPEQIQVLHNGQTRVVIRGQYGSGKTVLLILKARALLIKNRNVCIISMGHSPLIPVLEESIKHDIDPIFFPQIRFHKYIKQNELTQILKDCGKEERHVLIDEFPSVLSTDEELRNTISDFPSDITFWCIMSRETGQDLTKGPQHLFPTSKSVRGFHDNVMNKVLRCPPSVTKFIKDNDGEKNCIQGGPTAKFIDHTDHGEVHFHECEKCTEELNDMFIKLRLKAPQPNPPKKEPVPHVHTTPELSTQQQRYPVQAGAVEMSQNLLAQAKNPDPELTYSDMVILDNRIDPQSAAELFRKCDVPVDDKLDRLVDEDAFGSKTRVIYTTPRLFQGLERKIVVVITQNDLQFRSPLEGNEIVDFTELAVSRCSSQLIFILV